MTNQTIDGRLGVDVHHDNPGQTGEARLGEQRHVHDHHVVGFGLRQHAVCQFGAHGRMDDGVQVGKRRLITEHLVGHRRTVEAAVLVEDLLTEALHHGNQYRLPWGLQLVHHSVSIDQHRPPLHQQPRHRRLARPDSARQSNQQHGGRR